LARLLDYLNIYWKKRCTIKWTKFGDENTKFFPSIATERYIRNSIASLALLDGYVVSSHDEKDEVVFQAYKDRVGTSDKLDILFDLSSLPCYSWS
jgi:hypothetical protein